MIQKLEIKTVALGINKEVAGGLLGLVWAFSIIVGCKKLFVVNASKKNHFSGDLGGIAGWIWVDFSADFVRMVKEGAVFLLVRI